MQNKKRGHGRDDEHIGREDAAPEDPLKEATTLYVGNLYVVLDPSSALNLTRIQVILHYRGANP